MSGSTRSRLPPLRRPRRLPTTRPPPRPAPSTSQRGPRRRGVARPPSSLAALPVTLALAVVATLGQGDRAGRRPADHRPRAARRRRPRHRLRGAHGRRSAAAAVVVTALCSYLMNARLYRSTESGLATLRIKAFRHVHDLPLLTQNTERRGALVSRVTSDVDQVSTFLQCWAACFFIVSIGQVLIATVLMAVYSWQLTLVVWVCFVPLLLRRCAASSGGSPRPTWSGAGRRRCSASSPSRWSAPR